MATAPQENTQTPPTPGVDHARDVTTRATQGSEAARHYGGTDPRAAARRAIIARYNR